MGEDTIRQTQPYWYSDNLYFRGFRVFRGKLLKRILNMIKLIVVGIGLKRDADDIEAKLRVDEVLLADVMQRDALDLLLFGRRHHVVGRAVGVGGFGADFDKDDDMPVFGDDVNLAGLAAKIALDNLIVLLLNMLQRKVFSEFSQITSLMAHDGCCSCDNDKD